MYGFFIVWMFEFLNFVWMLENFEWIFCTLEMYECLNAWMFECLNVWIFEMFETFEHLKFWIFDIFECLNV